MDVNRFQVLCPNFTAHAKPQTQTNWCWAASASNVLNYEGIALTQDQLATYFTGVGRDNPEGEVQMMRALNPDLENTINGKIVLTSKIVCPNSDDIISSLSRGQPVLIGVAKDGYHHIITCYGAQYQRTTNPPTGQNSSPANKALLANASFKMNGMFVDPTEANSFSPQYSLICLFTYDPDQNPADGIISSISGSDFKTISYVMSRELARQILVQMYANQPQPTPMGVTKKKQKKDKNVFSQTKLSL